MFSARQIELFEAVCGLALAAGLAAYVVFSWHWPIVWDTQVMHYVNFLVAHGRAPYREITDMNMPGAYLTDWVGIHVFGGGDMAWRMYDFFLGGVAIVAMVSIARPYGAFGGLLAGALFTLAHGAEGPTNAVQRDQMMTVLLLVAFAALFASVRRSRPWLSAVFGLSAGLAATVKPTAVPLTFLVLLLAVLAVRRKGRAWTAYAVCGVGGIAAGGLVAVAYLVHYHALRQFLYILHDVLPTYAVLAAPSWGYVAAKTIQPPLLLFVLVAIVAGVLRRRTLRADGATHGWRSMNWEYAALGCGAVFGLASYLAQHKGYAYHRYPMLGFVLLWASLEIGQALRVRGAARWFGLGGLMFVALYSVPRYAVAMRDIPRTDSFSQALEADLNRLPARSLNGQVQCFDIVYGCMNALYHDDIVQYSGSTGDLLYFMPSGLPAVEHYRALFAEKMQSRPAAMFVISNQWFGEENGFAKIDAWPRFAQTLAAEYTLVVQRAFVDTAAPPIDGAGAAPNLRAYRIYVRKGTPLQQQARAVWPAP